MFRVSARKLMSTKFRFGCWVCAGTLMHTLMVSVAFAQQGTAVTSINGTPVCSSASFDSDGDGWGWENHRSCIVNSSGNSTAIDDNSLNTTGTNPSNTSSRFPDCSSADFDSDGDGFGWENSAVCIVVSSGAPPTATPAPPTVPTSTSNSTHPTCSSANSDPDGDGYGWENNRSCVVAETATDDTDTEDPVVVTPTGHPDCTDANSDPDGDGYGWENNRSCIVVQSKTPAPDVDPVVPVVPVVPVPPVAGPTDPAIKAPAEALPVVTPNGFNPFSKFQLGNTLYTNNVYDNRQWDLNNNGELIYYNGVQDFVRWSVPAQIDNDPHPCVRTQSAEPLTLSYRLTSLKDSPTARNTFVRAYPAMVVGTMGGRFESWGVECGALPILPTNAQRHGSSPVFEMETVAAATGMPVTAGQLDFDVRVSVKADLLAGNATNGVANVFLDSYWHDVSDPSIVPAPELVNTINGINSNFTEIWNLNIWFDYPRFEGNPSSWTGGFKIGSVSLTEGGDFDVYFKIEGARNGHLPRCVAGRSDNCFLYIALVATDNNASRNGVTINYTEIAQWMRSAAFRDLFLVGASETDTNAARAYEAWRLIDGTGNDNSPDPARRGPRFPDQNHVIGGMHLGAELWYNPNAQPASIVFETMGVEVEGKGQFGRYVRH